MQDLFESHFLTAGISVIALCIVEVNWVIKQMELMHKLLEQGVHFC